MTGCGSRIRSALAGDVPALQALERNAALAYKAAPGYAFCANLPVRSAAEHAQASETGISLVLEIEGEPIGFVLVLPTDGRPHILEAAVALRHQRRGHGRRLFGAVEAAAASAGFREITLTTYRDVPWNAPHYRRLGYAVFQPDDDRPELRGLIAKEADAGFAQAPRVAMRKTLNPVPPHSPLR